MVRPEESFESNRPEAGDFRHGTSEIKRRQTNVERIMFGSVGGKSDLGWLDAQTLLAITRSETGNDQGQDDTREPPCTPSSEVTSTKV